MATPTRHLTVDAVCDMLAISRRTFYEWRAKKRGPRCLKLPNGELRIRTADLDEWLESCFGKAA